MSIRDLKNRSRLALHRQLSIPAVYYDRDTEQATPCTVRVHHRKDGFGDMAGFDYAPAERMVTVPEIVALIAEVSPSRGGVYSIASDEAYVVETVMPKDGITVTTQVTRLRQSQIDAAPLPLPEQG